MNRIRAWARTVDPGWWLVAAAAVLFLVALVLSPVGPVEAAPPPTVGPGVYTVGGCP